LSPITSLTIRQPTPPPCSHSENGAPELHLPHLCHPPTAPPNSAVPSPAPRSSLVSPLHTFAPSGYTTGPSQALVPLVGAMAAPEALPPTYSPLPTLRSLILPSHRLYFRPSSFPPPPAHSPSCYLTPPLPLFNPPARVWHPSSSHPHSFTASPCPLDFAYPVSQVQPFYPPLLCLAHTEKLVHSLLRPGYNPRPSLDKGGISSSPLPTLPTPPPPILLHNFSVLTLLNPHRPHPHSGPCTPALPPPAHPSRFPLLPFTDAARRGPDTIPPHALAPLHPYISRHPPPPARILGLFAHTPPLSSPPYPLPQGPPCVPPGQSKHQHNTNARPLYPP